MRRIAHPWLRSLGEDLELVGRGIVIVGAVLAAFITVGAAAGLAVRVFHLVAGG